MNRHPASFRDPAGFIFNHKGKIFRQINQKAAKDYDRFIDSGLYELLSSKAAIVKHLEEENFSESAYKTISPEPIPFISYPYEWCFEQLKDAALLTLKIQKASIKKGMSLKDASAYNIQFLNGHPLMIDTLSFEMYEEGKPWVAYRQFCQHFFAPLVLAAHVDIRLMSLLKNYIDGIPLDLTSALLPKKTRLNFSIASHIHWHAKAQINHADSSKKPKKSVKVSKNGMMGILESLESAINKLTWKPGESEWSSYYNNTNYSKEAFGHKSEIVREYLHLANAQTVWDLGANDGTFSRIAAENSSCTIAFDIDPIAVNKNYHQVKQEKNSGILPLLLDLTNPSAALGWANAERDNLFNRANADCILALALIHHLAISNNLPLAEISAFLAKLAPKLIIEFVPKSDSKVQVLLATREDIFTDYNVQGFEASFSQDWIIEQKSEVMGSDRSIYFLKRRA